MDARPRRERRYSQQTGSGIKLSNSLGTSLILPPSTGRSNTKLSNSLSNQRKSQVIFGLTKEIQAAQQEASIIIPVSHQPQTEPTPTQKDQNKQKGIELFDDFLDLTHQMDTIDALKTLLSQHFSTKNVYVFEYAGSSGVLYCQYANKVMPCTTGLLGYSYLNRQIIFDNSPWTNQYYDKQYDDKFCPIDSKVFILPLFNSFREMKYVIYIIRDKFGEPFNNFDMQIAVSFQNCFHHFSEYLSSNHYVNIETISEAFRIMEIGQFLVLYQRSMKKLFNCKTAEIWKFDEDKQKITLYSSKVQNIDRDKAGIVGVSLFSHQLVNSHIQKLVSSYNPDVDGTEDQPILSFPYQSKKMKTWYSFVFRAKIDCPVFTSNDEANIRQLAPYIIIAFENDEEFEQTKSQNTGTTSIRNRSSGSFIEVAEKLRGPSDKLTSYVIDQIQSQCCATKVILLQCDNERGQLYTFVDGKRFEMTMRSGIAGKTYLTGQVYNIGNVLDDPEFDSSFDNMMNFKTLSVLSIPIFDQRKNVIGVVQLLNRKDNRPFSNDDINIATSFLSVYGVVSDNWFLYKQEQTTEGRNTIIMRSVSRVSRGSTNLPEVLNGILQEVKAELNAERFYVYVKDNIEDHLNLFTTDVEENVPPHIPKATLPNISRITNDAQNDKMFSAILDNATNTKTNSFISTPMYRLDGKFIGVIQICNAPHGFDIKDLRLLQVIGAICTHPIEVKDLSQEAVKGEMQTTMSKFISETEMNEFSIPHMLVYSKQEDTEANNLEFASYMWDYDTTFKVVFAVFNQFNLMKKFQITASTLFNFIFEARSEFQIVPFHNFYLAIDQLQFLNILINEGNLERILQPTEFLALIIATLCHDMGHDGVDNKYLRETNSPIFAAFPEYPNENHHFVILIEVIKRSGLFNNINLQDTTAIWGVIRDLILSSNCDPKELQKETNEIVMNGPPDMQNPRTRKVLMRLLVNICDWSYSMRSWDVCDKWSFNLFAEHFMQGDLMTELGLKPDEHYLRGKPVEKQKETVWCIEEELIRLTTLISKIVPDFQFLEVAALRNIDRRKERYIKGAPVCTFI
ncbi:GAF domain containing protein [Trichomonas vaginalis G3]|uniref:Phosphodiesterase n=1 Tax=Trichomonas vaginalis (strain ATCC PRA-98 / G3) TaxID=412133 RepID=A2DM77_TRIV3|nr:3',5'-cyclic-nucleotide phosphodiesterase protein [Trichomonas vaginalis G3]EAY18497.1 GAF domain containing protein [Trichomonas vaginalis G3]KAI5489514.1 3',5'-cyclic-nucleotide phosphodiesterase protein [Trichomonas vaginalis G3]|eukprot:XP_001579483.1 GAF domain containing protein [Trichomonas vaginalis G3]